MKKRKSERSKPIESRPQKVALAQQRLPKASHPQTGRRWTMIVRYTNASRRYLFLNVWPKISKWGRRASVLASIITLVLLGIPKISILTGVNASPTEAFGTQFLIKNEGFVPALDVYFSCRVDGQGSALLSNVSVTVPVATVFWPGETATRNCGIVGATNLTAVVHIDVNYRWPIYFAYSSTRAFFRGIKGTAGYFLVPDIDQR